MEDEKTVFINITKVALAIIILRCFYLQIIRFPYYRGLSYRNCIRTIETGIPRGVIYDRNMRPLAKDTPALHLVFVPYDLESPEREAEILSGIISMDKAELLKKFKRRYANPFDRVYIKRRLTKEEVSLIEEHMSVLPGIFVQEGLVREYILGRDTCHILGYTGEISEKQLVLLKEKGYKQGDFIGQEGIEKMYDDYLRGIPGGIQVEVDALGHQRKVMGKKDPLPGNNIVLTIDQTIQEIVSDALGDRRGCVAVMDPRNGQVLAMVSRPGFDSDNITVFLNREGNPFLNRVIKGMYSPGSVFKIITEITALESGEIEEYDRVECTGAIEVGDRVFHCWKEEGHGWVDINLALPYSCNVFFGTIGMKVGVSKMLEVASNFGFGSPTGIDLPGEKAGYLPGSREIDPLNLSIGQGPILTTPLQLLSLISTVANGGNIWRPYMVKEINSPDGKKIKEFTSELKRFVYVSSETMDILKRGLKNVVMFGTGSRARLDRIEVAGKTGTVQRAATEIGLGTHGFFVCYAPADSPKIAMVVFLDDGSSGQAAEIAGKALGKIFIPELIDNTPVETEETEEMEDAETF
ncbi:MAG: penicillin-binding protein 2 [Candidatus Ratteibacteria bacterium]|nr:penicillin-binding protein 2 [Candidatus Ratteibacteria bacterium]